MSELNTVGMQIWYLRQKADRQSLVPNAHGRGGYGLAMAIEQLVCSSDAVMLKLWTHVPTVTKS